MRGGRRAARLGWVQGARRGCTGGAYRRVAQAATALVRARHGCATPQAATAPAEATEAEMDAVLKKVPPFPLSFSILLSLWMPEEASSRRRDSRTYLGLMGCGAVKCLT